MTELKTELKSKEVKNKKFYERVPFRLTIGALLIVGIFLFYKFGWKYMGFQMTTDPVFISVYSTGENEAENSVWVTGSSPMNLGSFAGHITEYDEKTKTLYVGIRFNLSGNDTNFRVVHSEENGKVDKIVLRKNDIKRLIWERGKGVIP